LKTSIVGFNRLELLAGGFNPRRSDSEVKELPKYFINVEANLPLKTETNNLLPLKKKRSSFPELDELKTANIQPSSFRLSDKQVCILHQM